jgi:hypothetical protein
MPKFLVAFHMVLLGSLSALVFLNAAVLFDTVTSIPRSSAMGLAWAAMGLGLIMVITEVWSGVRWPALIGFGATVVGLVALCGRPEVPVVSVGSWAVAWLAVMTWFAVLAAKARSNR